jgi:REP element-mobilizing transposase RayT
MPKPRPAYLPGLYYHFYNRGHDRSPIFREIENYLFVIRKIKEYAASLQLTIIAYCLMPNHYHFLVRQDGEFPAGLLPQRVFNSYSKAYNRWYDHHGTLFESPYQVKLILKDAHLLHLCRYIHYNPQKDGLVANLIEWPYSNYLEWIGARNDGLVDSAFIIDNFYSQKNYQAFVLDGLELIVKNDM